MPRRRLKDPQYGPRPIDTSGFDLPPALTELLEALARHNHDVWAKGRLNEGWRWGEERNDARREHPGLVPYEDLTSAEQSYDRQTAEQLLRAMLALGWEIRPPTPVPAHARPDTSHPKGPALPDGGLAACRDEAQRLLRAGSPLMAYDVLREGLEEWSGDLRLRQLRALALARSGAAERATELLLSLYREGFSDPETMGLLAGRYKELAARARNRDERASLRRTALRFYETAYRSARESAQPTEACYAGINVATLHLLAGNPTRAAEFAGEVQQLCQQEILGGHGDAFWLHATMGEGALLLNRWEEAQDHYAGAVAQGRERWTEISTARRQAFEILTHLGGDPTLLERSLRIPSVGVLAHESWPASGMERGAANGSDSARRWLRERLADVDVGFGYASAEPGWAILFHEELLERGAEVYLVLPVPPQRFREARLASGAGSEWASRFDALVERAAGLHVASPTELRESAASDDYAARIRDGLAGLKARFLDTQLVHVQPPTADGRRPPVPDASLPDSRPPPAVTGKRVVAFLFADTVGYSRLEDEQMPAFVERFLGTVAKLAATSSDAPALRNTWGDGLYFVFDDVDRAARFALALNDAIEGTSWPRFGLPASLSLRIALHAGPVFPIHDPVLGSAGYAGSHVSRAARIEPITPPGHVYVSEPFAAIATALGVQEMAFDYVGRTSLAKGYGSFPLYHLKRR